MGCSASSAANGSTPKKRSIPAEQRARINAILDYWFEKSEKPDWDLEEFPPDMMKFWFVSTPEMDEVIKTNFLADHTAYMAGTYCDWSDDRDGALAALILLDQWSRNLYRKDPRAFASDPKALEITLKIISNPARWE